MAPRATLKLKTKTASFYLLICDFFNLATAGTIAFSFPELFNFPSALFNYAKTLVVLNLMGNNVFVNPPSSVLLGFPSLKTLHLDKVWYAKPDSFSRFLSCCPVLQDLTLHLQTYTYDVLKIIVPTLKRLYLDFNNTAYQYNKLEINAPALEYLCFSGYVIENVLLGILSNLVEAVIEVDYDEIKDYGNMIMDFIKQLSNVKSLHLDSTLTQVKKKKKNTFFSCSIIKWLNTLSWTISYIDVIIILLCSSFVKLLNLIFPCFIIWLS